MEVAGNTLTLFDGESKKLAQFTALSDETGYLILKTETGDYGRNQSVISIPFSRLGDFYDKYMALYLV